MLCNGITFWVIGLIFNFLRYVFDICSYHGILFYSVSLRQTASDRTTVDQRNPMSNKKNFFLSAPMCTTIVTAKGLSKYAIIAKQHSLRGAWLSSDRGGGVASAVAAAAVYSSTTPKKNTYLKGLPTLQGACKGAGFIFSYVLISQVCRWVRCYGLGLFS
jgi:hypothetical protein